MAFTREQRLAKYRESSKEVQDIYTSLEVGDLMTHAAALIGLPDASNADFGLLLGDFTLGLYPVTEFSERLQSELHLSPAQISQITLALEPFFEKLKLIYSTQPTTEHASTTHKTPETPFVGASAPKIEPLRTMQSDANRIHGYGAYRRQSEQPKPNANGTQPLVSPPRYVDIDENEK